MKNKYIYYVIALISVFNAQALSSSSSNCSSAGASASAAVAAEIAQAKAKHDEAAFDIATAKARRDALVQKRKALIYKKTKDLQTLEFEYFVKVIAVHGNFNEKNGTIGSAIRELELQIQKEEALKNSLVPKPGENKMGRL